MTIEQNALEAVFSAHENRQPATFELQRTGTELNVTLTGDLSKVAKGAGNSHVGAGFVRQIVSIGTQASVTDENSANFILGFLDAMQPRDAAESALVAQMAATHQLMMEFARKLTQATNTPQQDSAERAYNKLTRSYAAQMDTLKRYRSKGQQLVRVERVTVESGAQAIVGNVAHQGGTDYEK